MSKKKGNNSHISTFSLCVMLQDMSNCAKDQSTNQAQTSVSLRCLNQEAFLEKTQSNFF